MDFCDSLPGQTNTTWQVPGQGGTPAQKKTEKKKKKTRWMMGPLMPEGKCSLAFLCTCTYTQGQPQNHECARTCVCTCTCKKKKKDKKTKTSGISSSYFEILFKNPSFGRQLKPVLKLTHPLFLYPLLVLGL